MSESAGKPPHEYTVTGEPFMVVHRITQELITQQLQAALEQLDIIANAIREDDEATNLSLVYLSTVTARALLDGALKQLPWAPIPVRFRSQPTAAKNNALGPSPVVHAWASSHPTKSASDEANET